MLKPSNVLVRRDGRVTVLDFGLVADLRVERELHVPAPEPADGEPGRALKTYTSTDRMLMGTAAYMSPEQAAVQPLTPASDLYSLGIMLFQALTGRLPIEDELRRLLLRKQTEDMPPPSQLCRDVPPDLDALCVALLHRDPAQRPTAAQVAARLMGADPDATSTAASEAPQQLPFVGREQHLDRLRAAYEDVAAGRMVVCAIHGRSGTGKSTLTSQFLTQVAAQSDALILQGRCFEQESVPYKALDNLIDSLTRHLLTWPAAALRTLIPEGMTALSRLFPVLLRVPVLQEAATAEPAILEPAALRKQAASALRELLRRLGQLRPLVLIIDDLQWGDADSAVLLESIFAVDESLRALFMLCYRSEYAAQSPCLRVLLQRQRDGVHYREISVSALSEGETRKLIAALLGPQRSMPEPQLAQVVQQSGGNPFFVYELLQSSHEERDRLNASGLELDEILWSRMQSLPQEARSLLKLLAISGQPLPLRLIQSAARLGAVSPSSLLLLRHGRLIRGSAWDEQDALETYHDRIRETIVSHLPPDELRQAHQGLAAALESEPGADPEVVAAHFVGSGAPARAARYYAAAADRALKVLAFERAERLLKLAAAASAEPEERAAVIERMIHFYTDQARFSEAYAVGREEIAALGVKLPEEFAPPALLREILTVRMRLLGRKTASLAELPTMRDPRMGLAVRLISGLAKAAYQINPALCVHVSTMVVNICLQHGNTPECAVGYMAMGVIFLGGILGLHQTGYEYGQLALALNRKYSYAPQQAEVHFVVGYFGTSWLRPAHEAEALWRAAFAFGMESHDWFHTGCAALATVMSQLGRGAPLDEVGRLAEQHLATLRPLQLREPIGIVTLARQVVRCLRGQTRGPVELSDADFDEALLVAELKSYGSRHFAHFYFVAKMQLLYLCGQIADARGMADRSAQYLGDSRGLMQGAEHHFYDALISAAELPTLPLLQRPARLRRLLSTWLRLRRWASQCEANFRARERLIAGELARTSGRAADALTAYAQAGAAAEAHAQTHLMALAQQLAAQVHRAQGRPERAQDALRRASAAYGRWGAVALASELAASSRACD